MRDADVVMIVGTSMQFYPAASLIHYAPPAAERYLVDPNPHAAGAGVGDYRFGWDECDCVAGVDDPRCGGVVIGTGHAAD